MRAVDLLFQRAKIQDKCKQFTTIPEGFGGALLLFQRAKIQDKCKQFTTTARFFGKILPLFQSTTIQENENRKASFKCVFFP